ncbi:MAG TPA: SidA/IucD/PvdA family monooxygenase [Puia sp.]|nr:SidA/IucD/PvdA family monooxygenase [Puia sp.]
MSDKMNDYDVIGIGFGPANIAVAIAMEEMNLPLRVKFLESESASIWQKGMLIENSDVQNHPLRDLVTPRNPRSRFSFVNYLFENGRLFEYLNLGMTFPYRIEYAQYIEWTAAHFNQLVSYNTPVARIEMIADKQDRGQGYRLMTEKGVEYTARSIIVGTGRTPFIPKLFQNLTSPAICHISRYLESMHAVLPVNPRARIAVIGSSQSAVEVILHLSDHYPDAQITGIMRSFGYRLKDTSPFTGEVYFPEFVDLFYNAGPQEKNRLAKDLYYTNYSSVDGDVLDRLYRKIYMQKITKGRTIHLHRAADILEVTAGDKEITLLTRKMESSEVLKEKFDLVILATGFKNIGANENEESCPAILQNLLTYLERDQNGCIKVEYNYGMKMNDKTNADAYCFLNGLCESTHGMGDAGSFSLLSLRAKIIVETLLSKGAQQPATPFHVHEKATIFQ